MTKSSQPRVHIFYPLHLDATIRVTISLTDAVLGVDELDEIAESIRLKHQEVNARTTHLVLVMKNGQRQVLEHVRKKTGNLFASIQLA